METKQLEREFKDIEIGSERYHSWGMSDWQAEQCSSITIEHMKGLIRYYIKTVPLAAYSTGENNGKTIEQLIRKYFESLNK